MIMYFFFFELWEDIVGYGGRYKISNKGCIWNSDTNKYMKNKQNRRLHYVRLSHNGVRRQFCIEHLVDCYFFKDIKNTNAIEDLPGEIWKDIRGFEGKYQCSNKGRVKTLSRYYYAGRDYTCLRHIQEAILKPIMSDRGYLRVDLRCGSAKMHCVKWVHNLVARTFYNNYDMTLVPNHIDGVKTNNCIDNLELVTSKENTQHAIRTGLMKCKGEESPRSLLTNQQAMDIRLACIKGISRRDLAAKYSVGIHIIHNIVTNITYKDENYQYKNGKGMYI